MPDALAMTTPKSPQRIVIYRLGSLGDTVVALRCFHQVAKHWPDAERIVLTNFPVSSKAAPLEVILREGGLIHGAIAYPVGTRSLGELWRLSRRLRKLRAEVLVYLTPARGLLNAYRDYLFFRLCGFRHIVGIPSTPALQKPRLQAATSGAAGSAAAPPGAALDEEREAERLVRCLSALGPIDLDDPAMWDLRLTDHELHAGSQALASLGSLPYLAINMGGKAVQKDWGLDNWRTLLAALSERHPHTGLLVVGALEDRERAQAIVDVWHGPVIDACGTLSPRESAAAMRLAAVFVGHDSGPLHLAAAAGVPCVGLFGNFNVPKRWHPRGDQHRIIHRMGGLGRITVTEVIDAVQDIVRLPAECA